MDITKNNNYIEGKFSAQRNMIPTIERTKYGTLEEAIKVKDKVIKSFESELGFSREDENPDYNYARECGIFDALMEAYEKEQNTNPEGS